MFFDRDAFDFNNLYVWENGNRIICFCVVLSFEFIKGARACLVKPVTCRLKQFLNVVDTRACIDSRYLSCFGIVAVMLSY